MARDDIHFGLFTRVPSRPGISEAAAFQEFFRVVEASEDLGFDAIWIGEEHYEPGVFLSGSNFTLAAACAMKTTRLGIGLAIVAIPLSHPLRIAEAAATVDQISGGRVAFGAGRSSNIDSYIRSGVSYSESRDRQLEGIEVIKRAWTEERFTHEGRYYNFPDVAVVPKPYQKPHPPIYMAASSPESYAIAGRMGYNLFVSPRGELSTVRERIAEYRNAWHEAGHPGDGQVVGSFLVYVADTLERARSEPREGTLALWERQAKITAPREGLSEEANKLRARASHYLRSVPYEEHLRSDVIIHYGTPESVAEGLQELRDELGLSGFMLDMNAYNLLHPDQVIKSMRLFADLVRPRLG